MHRQAYTLLELLLVLAVLVVLAATAMPALRGVMRDWELQSAADTVRTEWTRAHVKAMKSGRIQVFRYELGGRKYTIQPFIAGDDALESSSTGADAFGIESAGEESDAGLERELPEGTSFAAGDALAESRSLSIEQEALNQTRFQSEWSRPILFYPDGSASDAFVVVGSEREVGLRVDLRGMTATASVGEITALEALNE
jgi:prepilin-type N-terminal cleavage/methylation domain-containing protein